MYLEVRKNYFLERSLELEKAIRVNDYAERNIKEQIYEQDELARGVYSEKLTITLDRETWSYVIGSIEARKQEYEEMKIVADAKYESLKEICYGEILSEEVNQLCYKEKK